MYDYMDKVGKVWGVKIRRKWKLGFAPQDMIPLKIEQKSPKKLCMVQ
jgi:hypothetical protein